MTDLLTRLEQATEGSRELDAAIAEEVHPLLKTYASDTERGAGHWTTPKDGKVYALDYTTSLDAALPWENIVECRYYEDPDGIDSRWTAVHETENGEHIVGRGKTEALARRIAALRARG